MPHVYFLQPAELVGTNRYKIGMSSKNNLNRVKSYKSGTRYICIMECVGALTIEKKLLTLFKDKFTLIAGNEYFQIKNETDALLSFIQVITDNTCAFTNTSQIELNPSYNLPENIDDQIIKSIDKHSSPLARDTLAYDNDDIYNNKFRSSIEKNKWIYIDNQTLEWMGYHSYNERKLKQRYLNLLSTFQLDQDYKYINSSELNGISINICDIPDTINTHNKVKHLLVSPQCFKETLSMLRTNKSNIVRKYYKDLTGSILTNESINIDLNQYGLQIVTPYTGKCEEQQTYECLSILKHRIVVTHSHMNETKTRGCVYCRKHNILEQIPIYAYTHTYEYIQKYDSFDQLKEMEPELNHQLLKNIIREERWLTVHHNKIYSILSPHQNKLDLCKPLTEQEQLIINTLNINYEQMKTHILRSKMNYVMGLDHRRKRAIYGNSMTSLANKIINPKTNKLINRKSISSYLDKTGEYAGYQWISTNQINYKNYQMIDCETL